MPRRDTARAHPQAPRRPGRAAHSARQPVDGRFARDEVGRRLERHRLDIQNGCHGRLDTRHARPVKLLVDRPSENLLRLEKELRRQRHHQRPPDQLAFVARRPTPIALLCQKARQLRRAGRVQARPPDLPGTLLATAGLRTTRSNRWPPACSSSSSVWGGRLTRPPRCSRSYELLKGAARTHDRIVE